MCERRVGGRYQLIEHIGEGGYGAVYRAMDVVDDREVVLKLEHHSTPFCSISQEVDAYNEVAGNTGFAEVYWLGQQDDFDVLAFELLGPSLTDLFVYCGGTFSLKTVLLIMDQLLERFRVIHEHEIVHRDVKPSNCLLGAGEKSNTLFVTDFGLSLLTGRGDGDDPEEQASSTPRAVGTAYFASIRGHDGRAQMAEDDLEALGHMMIYFLKGRLPWSNGPHLTDSAAENQALLTEKLSVSSEELCEGLPEEILEYMKLVRNIPNGPKAPDHTHLRDVLRRLSRRKGIEYDDVYDWTIRRFHERNGNKPAGPPCPWSPGTRKAARASSPNAAGAAPTAAPTATTSRNTTAATAATR
ncbi:casein kinase 1 [Elsinoe ampelina]|uniref:non-specific serine/threonine protein kinase n=1 Tax=Elsinoe ampelina TaxID=302913 RepID=A0A6A6GE15_9PEZI|nr:casein kinase 1 [Elsinoe ampelina]